MLARCEDPRDARYSSYGERGIAVCAEWRDGDAFAAWVVRNIGHRPAGTSAGGRALYSLDRIDNDRGYVPGNLRWATARQQRSNTRGPTMTDTGERVVHRRPSRGVAVDTDAMKAAREGRGLSRSAVGALIGKSAQWVSQVELGRNRPGPDAFRALARALQLDESKLRAS
jgi:DNA-binding transcriptional regulator YiaG